MQRIFLQIWERLLQEGFKGIVGSRAKGIDVAAFLRRDSILWITRPPYTSTQLSSLESRRRFLDCVLFRFSDAFTTANGAAPRSEFDASAVASEARDLSACVLGIDRATMCRRLCLGLVEDREE